MKTLSVLVMVLAVGLAGCGEDSVMNKDGAMKLVTTAMEKAGGLKDMLSGITAANAGAIKDKLLPMITGFLSAKGAMDKIPSAVKSLVGGKMGEATKMFDGIKGQAGKLMENADIKSQLGDMLGKLTG